MNDIAKINKASDLINWLTAQMANRVPISPDVYMEVAQRLNLLIADEQAHLYDLQQAVSQKKADLIMADNSVAKAKVLVEASDEYKAYLNQKARIDQIIEYIRISKIQARLTQDNMHGF